MKIKNPYVVSKLNDIEQTIRKASTWGAGDPELGAYLARYLVVLISGAFEDCFEQLVNCRADKAGDPELASFVRCRLSSSFQNPTSERIKGVLKDFNPAYRNQYRKRIRSQAEAALDSIVTNKNFLAHGNTSNMHVTIADVRNYYRRSNKIFAVLEDILA